MKIKFIVLTCEKYLHTRTQSVKNTWGKNQNIVFLSDKNGKDNIVSFDNLPTNYSELWQRYYQYIKNNDCYEDWIFFADDDTYVNIENLNKIIINLSKDIDLYLGKELFLSERATDKEGNYTGFPLNTVKGEGANLPLSYVSGGAGFLISKNTYKKLQNHLCNTQNIAQAYNTDVTFGFWIKNCKINVTNSDLFNTTNPQVLHHSKEKMKQAITYHYVNEKMMLDIHKIINE